MANHDVRDAVLGMAHAPLPSQLEETDLDNGPIDLTADDSVVTNGKRQPNTDRASRKGKNTLIAMFGKPTLVVGKVKEYPAKGFDGKIIENKWNTPLAVAVWNLGPGVKLSANISQTREIVQTGTGRVERLTVDMAIPKAISYDRKSAESVACVDAFKAFVMDQYDEWIKTAKAEIASASAATKRSSTARVVERSL